jgi:hypothetical protein
MGSAQRSGAASGVRKQMTLKDLSERDRGSEIRQNTNRKLLILISAVLRLGLEEPTGSRCYDSVQAGTSHGTSEMSKGHL